jgi:hypothetical protein
MGFGAEEGLRWREASEADAWAVGDEGAALGRGRTRQTTQGGIGRRPLAPFLRGDRGQQRGGGSGSGDATRCGGGVGPGFDRRAASRPRPGSGAPRRSTRGPRLAAGESEERGARGPAWRNAEWAKPV